MAPLSDRNPIGCHLTWMRNCCSNNQDGVKLRSPLDEGIRIDLARGSHSGTWTYPSTAVNPQNF